MRASIHDQNVLVYAANTKSNQVGLYFYAEAGGEFISSRYVGYSNPLEVASVKQTAEGDLIICSATYVAGRFGRFCLIKIPQSDITL